MYKKIQLPLLDKNNIMFYMFWPTWTSYSRF